MRYPSWRRCTILPVLQGFAGRKRYWDRLCRWWLSSIPPFIRPCRKSPDVMRCLIELAERHRIRRYGFHGIAHASLAHGYAVCVGTSLKGLRLITLQLGNGCSVAAIDGGRSVETSMGFTPLEGLVMGTRSGDVDASIVSYLSEREKVEPGEVERWLNERSGLLGISGRSNDMKELLRAVRTGTGPAGRVRHRTLLLSGEEISRCLPRRLGRRGRDRVWRWDWRKRPGD